MCFNQPIHLSLVTTCALVFSLRRGKVNIQVLSDDYKFGPKSGSASGLCQICRRPAALRHCAEAESR